MKETKRDSLKESRFIPSKQYEEAYADIHDRIVKCIYDLEMEYGQTIKQSMVDKLMYEAVSDIYRSIKETFKVKMHNACIFPKKNGVYNVDENKTSKDMKQTIRLNESQLRQVIKESIKKILNETYNPFDDYDFEEWEKENVEPVTDEEYNRIRKMDFIYHADEVFRKIGFKKWNGFMKRLKRENPEEYEIYDRENSVF